MALQYIGTISRPHGIEGECILSDVEFVPNLTVGVELFVGFSKNFGEPKVLEVLREYKNGAIIKLKTVDTIDAALLLKECGVFVDTKYFTAIVARQYSKSVIGFDVLHELHHNVLGAVKDVWQMPSQKTLVIESPSTEEILVPYVPQIVTAIDYVRRTITVNPPEGMFEQEVTETV